MKIYVLEKNGGSDPLKVLVSDLTLYEIPGGIDGMTKVTIVSINGAQDIEKLGLRSHDSLPPIQFQYVVLPFNLKQAKEYLEGKFKVEYL